MSAIYECECDSFEMYEEQDSFEMAEAVPGPGVPPGGLTGQVLKKRSDADYDTEWADESGGGGGTSDYTQLSNKPQINGNTLTGNKSGADLGLVNAETGKGLSTNDYTTADKNKLSGIEAQANKTVIDDTLTNTGEAADAKAVGDKISQLKSDVQDLQGDLAGLDAGNVAYDNSLTYAAGTVGKELGDQRNTLTQTGDSLTQLSDTVAAIGTLYTGTNAASLSVESNTLTFLASMPLDPGTYVITGGSEWNTSFTSVYEIGLYNGNNLMGGSRERNTGVNGGGSNITMCVTFNTSVIVNLGAKQTDSVSHTAQNTRLRAVKVA